MTETSSILFTLFQITWAYVWARKHLKVRRERRYARGRTVGGINKSYKAVSFVAYLFQNLICIGSFWSNADILFKVHNDVDLRLLGAGLIVVASALYFRSLKVLGENYSPCYDSQVPHELIASGPYRFVRHPMYLAKVLLGIGTFVMSGSLLTIPMFLWLLVEVVRSIAAEESYLAVSIPGYIEYQRRTARLVPFLL